MSLPFVTLLKLECRYQLTEIQARQHATETKPELTKNDSILLAADDFTGRRCGSSHRMLTCTWYPGRRISKGTETTFLGPYINIISYHFHNTRQAGRAIIFSTGIAFKSCLGSPLRSRRNKQTPSAGGHLLNNFQCVQLQMSSSP